MNYYLKITLVVLLMLMSTKGFNQTIELKTDIQNKETIVVVNIDTPWKIYSVNSNNELNSKNEIASGVSNDSIILGQSHLFQLFAFEANHQIDIKGLRRLPLEGQNNFRDLGGYQTIDGKTVKWGLLFRSGQLSNLTDNDLNYLSSIPLQTIIDFRTAEERNSQVAKLPNSVHKNNLLPVTPGNLSREVVQKMINEGDVEKTVQFLTDINEQLILQNQDQYKEFFAVLQNNSAPIMYNCTAGKDRTGLATALLLSALGVDMETIIQDYLLTNTYADLSVDTVLKQYNLANIKQAEALYTLLTVDQDYLLKALYTIEEHYGSVEVFLTEQLDVDIPLMRELYLY